jgi:hypothetical protein
MTIWYTLLHFMTIWCILSSFVKFSSISPIWQPRSTITPVVTVSHLQYRYVILCMYAFEKSKMSYNWDGSEFLEDENAFFKKKKIWSRAPVSMLDLNQSHQRRQQEADDQLHGGNSRKRGARLATRSNNGQTEARPPGHPTLNTVSVGKKWIPSSGFFRLLSKRKGTLVFVRVSKFG